MTTTLPPPATAAAGAVASRDNMGYRGKGFGTPRCAAGWRRLAAIAACWVVGGVAMAGEGDPAALHFPVSSYRLEGATLIPASRLAEVLRPYTGADETLDTLRRAVEAVEAAYRDAGYAAVRVQLPEQELEGGVVRLRVIEARLGRVRVEGNRHFSTENIRASVPMLVEGATPRLEDAGASLALANESFAKRTRLTLAKGEGEGLVDAQLRVADERPWRFAVALDNTGNETTGRHRLGVAFQHANLFDRDQSLSLQYITSPEKSDKVSIFGLGYKIPIYSRGDSVEIAYGRSNVDSGTVATSVGDYAISGRGNFASLRYNLGLPRFAGNEQHLVFAWDWRTYESRVVPTGGAGSLIPDLSSAPLGVTYLASSPEGPRTWKASLGVAANQGSGADGTTAAYNRFGARPGARARFQVWRWSLGAMTLLPGDWSLRAEMNGQETRDMLISGEQFGIGGMDSVRGFNEREVLDDKGHRGTVELATAQQPLAAIDGRINFVGFYDFGRVERNLPLAGERHDEGISSAGLGLRLMAARRFQLRADLARVLDGGGSKRPGDLTAHMQFIALF